MKRMSFSHCQPSERHSPPSHGLVLHTSLALISKGILFLRPCLWHNSFLALQIIQLVHGFRWIKIRLIVQLHDGMNGIQASWGEKWKLEAGSWKLKLRQS